MSQLDRYLEDAQSQLAHLREIAADSSRLEKRARISGWSVRQHVEHLVLAGEVMLSRMETCDLPPEQHVTTGNPRPIGRLVLALQKIPRGKAQAPDFTVPSGISAEELPTRLDSMLQRARALTSKTALIQTCRHRTRHPRLGDLTPSQWTKFLRIHQGHHLAIIQEIEASAPATD
jgi:hypothetical protein